MSGAPGRARDCGRLRVAFAGTPDFAAVALAALITSNHHVVGVLSQPDRPAGRGRKLVASPVKRLALEHGIQVQQPQTLKRSAAIEALSALDADVLVVAAYGLILPPEVLSLPPLGCLNIHASLLPRWRGAAPIHRAILAGDAQSGVAIMQMDAGLDTGDVLLERAVPVPADATSATLHDTLATLGAGALLEALDGRCRGTLSPRVQPRDGVTYAAKLDKAEAVIDWTHPAIDIDRRVRAFVPWPIAESVLDGDRVRVWGSRRADGAADAPAGTVLALTDDALMVATGDGRVALTQLQRDGGRPMPAAAFAHDRGLVGRRFGA